MLALSEGTAGVLGGGEAKETLNVIIQSEPQIKKWETQRQVKAPEKGVLCAGSVTLGNAGSAKQEDSGVAWSTVGCGRSAAGRSGDDMAHWWLCLLHLG